MFIFITNISIIFFYSLFGGGGDYLPLPPPVFRKGRETIHPAGKQDGKVGPTVVEYFDTIYL